MRRGLLPELRAEQHMSAGVGRVSGRTTRMVPPAARATRTGPRRSGKLRRRGSRHRRTSGSLDAHRHAVPGFVSHRARFPDPMRYKPVTRQGLIADRRLQQGGTIMQRLTRTEMIELIERLMRGEGDDDEAGAWIDALERAIPNPHVVNLIFYPQQTLTAEQILDKALAYRPIEL